MEARYHDWKRKHGKQKLHTSLLKLAKAFSILSWYRADERRAASLEIIARTAYTAEESACHYLETIGLDRKGRIRRNVGIGTLSRYNSKPMKTFLQEISTA